MPRVGVVDNINDVLIDFNQMTFRIIKVLRSGSFGDPFVVEPVDHARNLLFAGAENDDPYKFLNQTHVIKMIRRNDAPSEGEELMRHRTIELKRFFDDKLGRLNHPNVVRYFCFTFPAEYALQYQHYYYSVHMELCNGGDLVSFINRTDPAFTEREQSFHSLVLQVVSGLSYLHYPENSRHRIVHTDINAANIFVQLPGPSFKIGDIDGCGKVFKAEDTQYGDFDEPCGKPSSMSPEMLSQHRAAQNPEDTRNLNRFRELTFSNFSGSLLHMSPEMLVALVNPGIQFTVMTAIT